MKFNFRIITILIALNFIFVFAPLQIAHSAVQPGFGGGAQPGMSGSGQPAFSGNGQPGFSGKASGILNPIGSGDLQTFLKNILHVFVILGSMVVVFFIIYAGLQYVLARGDETAIKKAHNTLTWTIIGAAILLGAEAISLVISNTVQELAK